MKNINGPQPPSAYSIEKNANIKQVITVVKKSERSEKRWQEASTSNPSSSSNLCKLVRM